MERGGRERARERMRKTGKSEVARESDRHLKRVREKYRLRVRIESESKGKRERETMKAKPRI